MAKNGKQYTKIAGTWEQIKPSYTDLVDVPTDFNPSAHDHTLSEITDAGTVAAIDTNASTTQFLRGDGTWATPADSNTTYTAGSGLSLTGTVFANTAPDQTVSLTGSGATTVTGTYPNFTISSTDTNTTYDLTPYALKASPAFTGTPTAPTASSSVNNTQIATTAYVTNKVAGVAGGLNFEGTIDLSGIGGKNGDDLAAAGLTAPGDYLIVNGTGVINNDGSPLVTLAVQAPGDEGDSTIPVTLETGDWIVYVSGVGSTMTVSIINNTDTRFAPTVHTHDDRYYTESESDSRFVNVTGDTITGNLRVDGSVEIGGDLEVVGNSIGFINTAFDAKIEVDDSNPNGTGAVFNFFGDGVSRNATLSAEQFDGNAATASSAAKWTTARTLSLTGDASGSTSWDGSGNASISVVVNNNSHTHSTVTDYAPYLYTRDNRTIAPSEDNAYRLRFGFTSWANNNTSPYADYLHLRSYSDSSGGSDNLVMFKKSGIGMRIWQQSFGSGTAYSNYVDVIDSSTIGSQSVSYATNAGKLDNIDSSQFLRSDATDLYTPARLDFGSTGNWNAVGYGNATNLHFRDHNQFWVGAGNGTWFTGTANQKSQASGLAADATYAHDLLVTTMQSDVNHDRGITFAVDSNASGTGGWRLGKWHSGINQASSMLAVNGQIHAKGGHTDSTDYYADDYSSYYDDGIGSWGGDTSEGWHKPSILAAKAIQIQSGTGATNSAKPQIQFHQYGYGGPKIEYDGPADILRFQGPSSRLDWVEFNTSGVTNGLRINYDQIYSPARALYIQSSASQNVYMVTNGGNVGIGTSSPGSKLDVNGSAIIRTDLYMDNGRIYDVEDIFLNDVIYHDGDTDTYMQFHDADQWRVVTGGAERLEVNNSEVKFARQINMQNYDIYGVDQIFHHGDTNTYMQFHNPDQWRVVTGGGERLEVNNSSVNVQNGLVVNGSIDTGATNYGYYESAGTNIWLKGDGSGRSGIFFESEKNGTNINDPSDFGFIQFHAYGYSGSSGESNGLYIGVANDSSDGVVIQTPYKGGAKLGFKNTTSGTGLTTEIIASREWVQTAYASSTVGGTVKMSVSGTTLYITNNGSTAA